MTQVAERTDRAHYAADLEKIGALEGPDWLKIIREDGADRFAQLEFPHYKQEAWRFTNIAPIVATPFRSILGDAAGPVTAEAAAPFLYDEPSWPQLVFVDGLYSPELSKIPAMPDGVRIGNLASAIAKGDETVRQHLDHYAEATSAFIALNAAFLQDGVFFFVANGVTLETPVHFVYLSTGADTTAVYPRNLFVIGKSAEAVTIETYAGLSGSAPCLTNCVSEIVIEDNATLHRHKIVQEDGAGFHLATAKVVQGRDTTFRSFAVTLSGRIVRNELDVVLAGEGGNALLNGLYLNDGDRLIDNALHVTHAKPRCYSRMAYKGVLDGTSRAVFTGKVLVPKDSQRTDSNQLNNNLLLSDTAAIDTKPQLEIFADDVKCTHGATIGGFPRELLFYFQSRGMAADRAQAILTFGFASEIVDAVEVGPLQARLARHVFDQYSPR